MTYKELDSMLRGRNSQRRKLANNTYAERRSGNKIAIRLHGTDILTYNAAGNISVTTGGWKTVTTKARINEYLPHGRSISARKGLWYWNTGELFTEGAVIDD